MRYVGWLIISMLVFAVTAAAARRGGSGTAEAITITPLWRVEVNSNLGRPGTLALTANNALFLTEDHRSMVVLDRFTGRQLWRRDAPASKPTDSPEQATPRTMAATGAKPEELVVFQQIIRTPPANQNGETRPRWDYRLRFEALGIVSGRTVWQQNLPLTEHAAGHGNVATVVQGDRLLVAISQPKGLQMERLELATGAVVPASAASPPAGVKRELQAFAVVTDELWGNRQGFLADPTGRIKKLTQLVFPAWEQSPAVVGTRVIAMIDTDDGGVGHSGFPKYVHCVDLAGKTVWRYPRRFAEYNDPAILGSPTPSVRNVWVHQKAGVAAVDSDRMRGFRIRDGRLLWSVSRQVGFAELLPYATGFLGFQPHYPQAEGAQTGATSLAYVSGSTGKTHWLTRLPVLGRSRLEGDILYTTSSGAVHAYRVRPGLPAAARHR